MRLSMLVPYPRRRFAAAAIATLACCAAPFALGATAPSVDPAAVNPVDDLAATQSAEARDGQLLDQVVSRFAINPTLRGARIDVTVTDGKVTLTGTGATAAQVNEARRVALDVAGSGNVIDDLGP